MQELPPLFDPKNRGKFMPLADDVLQSLPPERQSLYHDVADAAADLEHEESNLKAATDHVADCVRAVADAEKVVAQNRPTFHELWKTTFGRPRHVNGR